MTLGIRPDKLMRLARGIGCATILLVLASCGGYTPITFPPVPVPEALTKVALNPNYAIADKASFASAKLLYPARLAGDYHTVPVGEYLLSRVVLTLPSNAGISAIRMQLFDCRCNGRGFLGPHLWCVYDLAVAIRANGSDRTLTAHGERDVGPVYVPGDFAFPFTTGDYQSQTIHHQAKLAVDAAANALAAEFGKSKRRR